MTNWTEEEVQQVLMSYLIKQKRHDMTLPNPNSLFKPKYEADLVSLQNGMLHEFEIKCSKADYLREFKTKKRKHGRLKKLARNEPMRGVIMPNRFWFVSPKSLVLPDIPFYAGYLQVTRNGVYRVKNSRLLHRKRVTRKQLYQFTRLLSYRIQKD